MNITKRNNTMTNEQIIEQIENEVSQVEEKIQALKDSHHYKSNGSFTFHTLQEVNVLERYVERLTAFKESLDNGEFTAEQQAVFVLDNFLYYMQQTALLAHKDAGECFKNQTQYFADREVLRFMFQYLPQEKKDALKALKIKLL